MKKNKMEQAAKRKGVGCWGAMGFEGALGGAGEEAAQKITAAVLGSQAEVW